MHSMTSRSEPLRVSGLEIERMFVYRPGSLADGLDVLRRVIDSAPPWLARGGYLLVETSERQAPQAVETFVRDGLIPRVASSDELNATVVIGTRPALRSGPGH